MLRSLADHLAPYLPPAQRAAFWVALGSFVLGFLASIDVLLLPRGEPRSAWIAHGLLLLLGVLAGFATTVRGRQIDRWRWEILDDPLLTEGERELAHKEAERQRRSAGRAFLLAPLFLGYWMAYQLAGQGGEGELVTYLLIAPPLLGFALGLILTNRALGPEETRF